MKLQIRYIGHATFEILSPRFDIVIDPYFTEDGRRLTKPAIDPRLISPTHVFITHEHFDHCDEQTIKMWIRKKPGLKIFGPPPVEIKLGMKIVKMNTDNYLDLGDFSVRATPAMHPQSQYPIGYLFDFDGLRVWHAGDTYYFDELKRISTDVALVPIGGKYTMDAKEAAKLIQEIKPKIAIPMHYSTFEEIAKSPEEFVKLVDNAVVLEPGEVIEIGDMG